MAISDRAVKVIWSILKKKVKNLTNRDAKKINQNRVYSDNYSNNTKQRNPKATEITDFIKNSVDGDVRNLAGRVNDDGSIDEEANRLIRDNRVLVNNIFYSSVGRSIFSDTFYTVYTNSLSASEEEDEQPSEEDKQPSADDVEIEEEQPKKKKKKKKKKSKKESVEDLDIEIKEEPSLTFADVTLLESEWKLLLNITTNTVDKTLTGNQRRLNRMRLEGKLKDYAKRNDTNTPSVQSGLMEYKESLESRNPGRQQQVFRPDTNVKTTTPLGFVARSLGVISNQIDEVKGGVTNATIRAEEREAKASEQRNIIMSKQDELKQTMNDLSTRFPNLTDKINRIESKIKNKRITKKNNKMLDSKSIQQIQNSIPVQYRSSLSGAVSELLSGSIDLNVIASGLLGLATVSALGPTAGNLVNIASGYLLDTMNINLNDYLYEPAVELKTETQSPINPLTSNDRNLGGTITNPSTETKYEQNDAIDDMSQYINTGGQQDSKMFNNNIDSNNEFIVMSAENLAENAINEIDMKLTEDEERGIRIGAREYIITQLNGLRIAISQQMATPPGRTTQVLDISNLDLDDIPAELANPLGFFDYIRNVGGLPQVIMNNIPDINLNKLREAMPVMMEIKSKLPNMPGIPGFMRGKQPDLIQPLGPDGKPVPDKGVLRNFAGDMKDRLENIDRKNFPTGDEIKEGVYNAVGGAVIPAVVRGGAMGGVGAIARGGIGGAGVGAITGPMIRRYYEQQGLDMSDPEVKRYIAKIQALPPMIAGALIGATGIGENVFSGAGVTERKITVDPSVLAETMATEQQDTKQTKKWITKAIFPTPDILDETQQEKFVDDIEFSMFNFIEPSSQGATGTIKTNPLKRSQFLSDQIRYMDAGISMSGMLYNKEFPTNTNQQQLDTYKLGQEMLPEMTFMEQDNADTFTPIGRHYVNNQDIAVEMFSPFTNFSDNRNYWQINERSKLYNLYA